MKQFTSILCALVIAMSAVAAPRVAGITSTEKEKTIALTKPAHNAKITKDIVKPDFNRAPKAKKEHKDVTITLVQVNNASGNNYIMYSLIDGVNMVEYDFAILRVGDEEDIESGKTYTISEMDGYFCYWFDDEWNGSDFSEVSFTKTVATDGAISIVVDATDNNGDTFHLTYEKAAPEAVDTPIDINFTDPMTQHSYDSDFKDWYFVAMNADYAVSLDIPSTNATSPAGSYETEDFDLSYTGIFDFEVGDSRIKATSAAAEITVNGERIDITAVLKCEDGNTYRVTMFYEPASYDDAKDITIKTVETQYYSSSKDIEYTLTNAAGDSVFVFDIDLDGTGLYDVELGKEYAYENMWQSYSYATFNNTKVTYKAAKFIKTADTEGLVHIEAFVVDAKDDVWHLIYQEEAVAPSGEEVNVNLTANMTKPERYSDGSWLLRCIDEEQNTTVQIYVFNNSTTSPAGSYNKTSIDLSSYTFIKINDVKTYFVGGTITVTEDTDGKISVVAAMLDQDGVTYNITMSYTKPEPVLSDLTLEITADDQGIKVTPSNNTDKWDYAIISKDNLEAFGGAEAVANLYYNYYGNQYAQTGTQIFAWESETLAYYCDADGIYVLIVWGAGDESINSPVVSFEFAYPHVATAVDNVNAATKAVKSIENGQLIINVNGVRYNAVGATIR